MVQEIVTSAVLLLVGIAVLVMIHVCIVGRIQESIETSTVLQRGSTMSQDDIKKLPCYDYKVDQEDDDAKDMKCAVCLEGFKTGEKCRLLPNCSHSFHAHCIDSWLIKTATCPICRTSVYLESQSRVSSEVCLELP